ncbi:VPLPA-CTERM sorting domain-containing protein [Meridianimarinicoccus sp. RP-17]|uniref:VPLPA-CTERM sorting domain-containing protein n=1 Tax=Meridianimarinicoccus zhengii TaxID=2056810 RepID=UPI000DACCDC9|nr:VPLPA-CTERM sorting domain-containing protein [Phycocomes zhengii]
MQTKTFFAAATVATLGLATAAQAHVLNYEAILNDLSNLGGSGTANLTLDTHTNMLDVSIMGTGFAPNMLHVQHIHGRFNEDGSVRDTVSPSLDTADANGDGVIQLLEGVPFYGPIVMSLFDETDTDNGFMGFPAVTDEEYGTFTFNASYDLNTTTAFGGMFGVDDLLPLDMREIVIHGAFLSPGIGGVGNEADDDPLIKFGGYSAFVPVAAGEIRLVDGGMGMAPVPLPAAGWLMVAGIGGLAALRRRKRA